LRSKVAGGGLAPAIVLAVVLRIVSICASLQVLLGGSWLDQPVCLPLGGGTLFGYTLNTNWTKQKMQT
jgi:hypothetical protein